MVVDTMNFAEVIYVLVVVTTACCGEAFFRTVLPRHYLYLIRVTIALGFLLAGLIATRLQLPLFVNLVAALLIYLWTRLFDRLLLPGRDQIIWQNRILLELLVVAAAYCFVVLWLHDSASSDAFRLTAVGSSLALGFRLVARTPRRAPLVFIGMVFIGFALALLGAVVLRDQPLEASENILALPVWFFEVATVAWVMTFCGVTLIFYTNNLAEQMAVEISASEQHRRMQWSQRMEGLDRQRALGLLSSSLQHELRQPLSAMKMNAQLLARMLRKEVNDAEAVSHCVQELKSELARFQSQISAIRDFLGVSNEEDVAETRVEDAVSDILRFFMASIQSQGVMVETTIEPNLKVVVLPQQFRHTVLHVVLNALEAFSADENCREPKVTIVGESIDERYCRLSIHDNGGGMPEAFLPKAGKEICSDKPDRIGLGLMFISSFVERAGGVLSMHNQNNGFILTMTLPKSRN